MEEYYIAIVGGRDFDDRKLAENELRQVVKENKSIIGSREIHIVSGGAQGADTIAEEIAIRYHIPIKVFNAEWNDLTATPCKIKYNKYGQPYNCLAGFNRNKLIINTANFILLFWDGKSKGTAHDLELCKKYNKKYKIVHY